MDKIYVFNSYYNTIEVIDIDSFILEKEIVIKSKFSVSPHPIYMNMVDNKKNIINYKVGTIMDLESNEENYIAKGIISFYQFKKKLFFLSEECSSLIICDKDTKGIEEIIPVGGTPFSMTFDRRRGILIITDVSDSFINIYDIKTGILKKVQVGLNPTKAILSTGGEYLIVCESAMEKEINGSISIISINNFKTLDRIMVGVTPYDIYISGDGCIVSNLGEGSIKIIDLKKRKEIKTYFVGGIPSDISYYNENIYYCDKLSNSIIRLNINNGEKKKIMFKGEPKGIFFSQQ